MIFIVVAQPAGPCGTLPRVPLDYCLICFLQILEGLIAAFAVRHKRSSLSVAATMQRQQMWNKLRVACHHYVMTSDRGREVVVDALPNLAAPCCCAVVMAAIWRPSSCR